MRTHSRLKGALQRAAKIARHARRAVRDCSQHVEHVAIGHLAGWLIAEKFGVARGRESPLRLQRRAGPWIRLNVYVERTLNLIGARLAFLSHERNVSVE